MKELVTVRMFPERACPQGSVSTEDVSQGESLGILDPRGLFPAWPLAQVSQQALFFTCSQSYRA